VWLFFIYDIPSAVGLSLYIKNYQPKKELITLFLLSSFKNYCQNKFIIIPLRLQKQDVVID
jgi:hypothetical protein